MNGTGSEYERRSGVLKASDKTTDLTLSEWKKRTRYGHE